MKTSVKLLIGLGLVTLVTPLGMLAKGSAWGEWTSAVLGQRLGFVPEGMRKLEGLWAAKLAGYSLPGWQSSWKSYASYLISAAVGVLVIGCVTWGLGKMLAGGRKDQGS